MTYARRDPHVARGIGRVRLERGWTLRDMALLLGCDPSRICRIQNGERGTPDPAEAAGPGWRVTDADPGQARSRGRASLDSGAVPGDMHVAVLKNEHGDIYFHAEWPYDLPQGWNERTIIAADHDSAGAVFALTPTTVGQMRADPLPLEPGTGPSFGYGYDGGSPYTLYQALIRCAFSAPEAPFTLHDVQAGTGPAEIRSDLWQAIATTQGPLRLPWPAVLQWARADAAKAGYTGSA